MTTEAIEQQRREIYEIAEAVAPGWERWRARIEEVTAPARESMMEVARRRGAELGLTHAGYEIPGVALCAVAM